MWHGDPGSDMADATGAMAAGSGVINLDAGGGPASRPAVPAGDHILASRITAPDVPEWAVPRPRVGKLITQGTRWCALTVVTGPAGAGKTMALALWSAAESGPVGWVGLDEFDNRPGAFWSYVVAALRRAGLPALGGLPAVAPGPVAGHLFLLRLASALAAQDPPAMLVIDDLDLLTDPGVLHELDFVLRNAGPGLRLVACSRMDLQLPLHRYRVAGELAEIRASDLAFTAAEAALLLERHGITLPPDSLECLTRRTEGWAAGLRLAAISMGSHRDPAQFVTQLASDDNALTGYLVEEVLNAQPPDVREVLLSTSILEQVSAEAASELAGDEHAGRILAGLTRANAFVQPAGGGWYRYHTLFAEVLRLKLRREHPDRVAALHRQAARWYERNGRLTDAVRHAARAGDWPLAARMVIDQLAIGDITEPRDGRPLAGEFRGMPHRGSWTGPQPYLVLAAMAVSAGRPEPPAAALEAAEGILEQLPAGQQAEGRLAAAMIRLTAARRAGDLTAAAAAAARAEALLGTIPGDRLARHPDVIARVLSGRGAVELWSGHLDQAACVLDSAVAAVAASGRRDGLGDCLGHLALVEALRGRLGQAAGLATRATAALPGDEDPRLAGHPSPAALVALALVHLERNQLREARTRLQQADAALGATPDKLTATVAYLVAATGGLAEGRPGTATEMVARARSAWTVPAWLDQRLSWVESRAHSALGCTRAALAAAERAGRDDSPEVAVTLAHAWTAAGDRDNARRALDPVLADRDGAPEQVRLHAWLADARISYYGGDSARGRRSLASALRLAQRNQLRLPFALERGWIEPVLQADDWLAGIHQHLLGPARRDDRPPVSPGTSQKALISVVESLTEREREVLRHYTSLASRAEVASQMYISVNTLKSHLKSIYRKLDTTRRSEAVRRARQLELI
jgi:LuxR family maltose regulon positive regulatory protein